MMTTNALIEGMRPKQDLFVQLRSVVGNRSMRCSRLWRRASPYLVHPWTRTSCIPAVVSGFWNNLAAHLAPSPLNHSYSYASAGDRATCFARLPQKSGSW